MTNTVVFPSVLHLRGEGRNFTTIMMPEGIEKDILRTQYANNALTSGSVDYDHGLLVENLSLLFAGNESSRNTANACLVICKPGENNMIRNVSTKNGAIGIRSLGAGDPGLRLENVGVGYQAVAGISIEPSPGLSYASGGPVAFNNISGDYFYNDAARSNNCFIRFSNAVCMAAISGLKVEGYFGGGVVQYKRPDASVGWGGGAKGAVSVRNCTHNATGTTVPCDFIVLKSDERTPSVVLEGLNLFGSRYLIRDEVNARNVEADVNVVANSQMACRLPIYYEGRLGQGYADDNGVGSASRLVLGQTAYSYLYATNAGWYRVMIPLTIPNTHIAGKLVISSYGRESAELQIDVTPGYSPQVSVARASRGASNPIVTQARAFTYWDYNRNAPWGGVDIYVGNPWATSPPGKDKRITFALDLNGVETFDYGQIELIGVPYLVSASLPTNAVSTVVNTYR